MHALAKEIIISAHTIVCGFNLKGARVGGVVNALSKIKKVNLQHLPVWTLNPKLLYHILI